MGGVGAVVDPAGVLPNRDSANGGLFASAFDKLEGSKAMATVYVRTFNLKDSLSDREVIDYWQFLLSEAVPVVQKVSGVRSVRLYSGAGALRADCRIVIEMDDAGVYERLLTDPGVRKTLLRDGKFYGAMDLKTSTQAFRREVTPALLAALSGS
jgi:hypothetical protein